MSGLRDRHVVGGAVAACAVCCAAPIFGFLGVAGLAATAMTLAFAGGVFAIVVGLAAVLALLVRRSRGEACDLRSSRDNRAGRSADGSEPHHQLTSTSKASVVAWGECGS